MAILHAIIDNLPGLFMNANRVFKKVKEYQINTVNTKLDEIFHERRIVLSQTLIGLRVRILSGKSFMGG